MALGNIEVGGLFTKFFSRAALVVHAGIALPTAQDEGLASQQFVGTFTRLSDIPNRIIQSTWLRLGLSPMGRAGIPRCQHRRHRGVSGGGARFHRRHFPEGD